MAKKVKDITKTGALSYRDLQEMNNLNSDDIMVFTDDDLQDRLQKNKLVGSQQAVNWVYDQNAKVSDYLESSSLAGQQTRTGNHDYWGNSSFDDNIIVGEQDWNNLSDVRAENQPWYSKLVNGIGKAGILAATTAAELGGLIYGLGQGAYNAATFDSENDTEGEGNRAGAFLHGLWDNPITRALQVINETSEEYMPNYYTRDEQENPFSNIFTANFLGDKILKNLGFMVGAFYGGIPLAKGIGALGTRAVKNARNVLGAEMQGISKGFVEATAGYSDDVLRKVGQYGREIQGLTESEAAKVGARYGEDVTGLYRKLAERGLTEGEKGQRMLAGLERINEIANTTRATTQTLGALGSAINEGAIEALNNSKDWAETKTREENDRYQKALAEVDMRYGGLDTDDAVEEKMNLAQEHEMRLAEIEKGRATMGNADLLMNIPILTYSNWLQLGKLYTRGFDTTRRRLGSFWNGHKLSGSAMEGTLKTDKTWKGAVGRGLRNSLSEGSEEFLQRSASDAAGNEVMASIDRYFDSGKSEDSKINLDNYIAGFAKAVADNAGNPQAWEEFMIGALSSMIGMPVFGSQTKNAYMKLGPVGFAGGMVGSYKDYMAEKKHEHDIANYLNDRVHGKNSQKFRALYDYLRKSEDYEQALMTALENNDKEEYKNLEAEKLFEDINAFASAGHLEEFKQLIGYNDEYDAAELADIVKNTRRPVSAAQQKARDTQRLRDVTARINQIGKLSAEEDTSKLDEELNSLRKEISTQNKLLRRANDDDSKQNISQELSRLNQRYNELNKQKQEIVGKNMQAASMKKEKEDLEKERDAINTRLAGEYKDTDEGEFVQMVNGVPIGMDTIPDTDEDGNPIAGTEGNEMRRILDRNRNRLLKGINDYLKIRDNIDTETDGRLEDSDINLLTRMKMQILDQEMRNIDMIDDLVEGLKPVQEMQKKAKKRAEDALERAKNAHTVALNTLNEAKANKDVSPEDVAELEKRVIETENNLKTAEKGVKAMTNAIDILGMLTDPIKTTRRERKALDRGYGKDEEGNTYSDLYDNENRNSNYEEVQNTLMSPLNAVALSTIVNMDDNGLSDAEKQKYAAEIWSIAQLGHNKKAYNDQLRKFMKDPSLIKESRENANVRMTEKEIDNKSDELALRIRRAKDMIELDGIMKNSQIAPEVAQKALQKAKQDSDEERRKWISDYEKAKNFFDAFVSKMVKYPQELRDAFISTASVAWNDALMDDSDASKYDKFIELMNKYADELEESGHKEQAEITKEAIKELSDAANATATNSSSSVRTPSSSSTTTTTSSTGASGSSTGSAAASTPKNSPAALLKRINDEIKKLFDKGKIISSIDGLGAMKSFVESYNRQVPADKQITDEYIQQKVEELSNESLNEDENKEDNGSTLSEQDYKNEKSSKMKGHLRVTFKSDGVTEYRVYEGEKGAVLLESKEDYSRSEIAEAIHQILKDTHAYDFLSHNYLGYLQQSLRAGESITVHLLRPKNDKVGNKVFLAIEWTPAEARAIKRMGYGEDSDVTIPDTSIEAVDKDGKTKRYQIIGDLSILSEDDGMDPGISRAFDEVVDAVNEELNPVLENNDAQWAVSSLTSSVDTIYTGRLVKKENMDDSADRKVGLHELVSNSSEWNGEDDFMFGVVTNEKVNRDNNKDVEEPNPAWVQNNKGAILLFVPKPDGKLYPIRCTRRTVAEWFDDANGEALLDQVLSGKSDNEFLQEIVDTLRDLMNPEAAYGVRVKAKMDLKKYFVLGSGGKKVSVHFGNDTVRISLGSSAHENRTITVDKNNVDASVKEFFELMRKNSIPFSIPLPTQSSFDGKDIISSGIFKIGLKDFYNFNPSFTVIPINKNGEPIEPEVPESEREHFAANNNTRPNSYELNLGSGRVLYHQDIKAATPTFYKSKVDKSGNPVGAVEKVTDAEELELVSTAVAVIESGKGEEAIHNMLNALKPGNNFKEIKDAYKQILADSWGKVYIIRTTDSVWYFDNRSSKRGDVKIFKQGTPQAEKLKEEFAEDVAKHEAEAIKLMNEGGSKPSPVKGGQKGSGTVSIPSMQGGTREVPGVRIDKSDIKVGDIIGYSGPETDAVINYGKVTAIAGDDIVINDYVLPSAKAYYRLDMGSNQNQNTVSKEDAEEEAKAVAMSMERINMESSTTEALKDLDNRAMAVLSNTSISRELRNRVAEARKKVIKEINKRNASGDTGTGAQEGKVVTGKKLEDFKGSSAPRVIQLLLDKKTKDALNDYVDTIYKDLQWLEAQGVSVLDDDIYDKIVEIRKITDNDDEQEKIWKDFVKDKPCGK